MGTIDVHTPGPLTTVQDRGRPWYRHLGIPSSGAMDQYAATLANFLVGNNRGEALLECTFQGPALGFGGDCVVAVTGGSSPLFLNDAPVPMWRAFGVKPGDRLRFAPIIEGCRQYIAFSGGLDVPEVLGSRSTCLRLGLGGVEGRALRAGDVLNLLPFSGNANPWPLRQVDPAHIPVYTGEHTLRAVPGPQMELFAGGAEDAFFATTYTVTGDSDRMGYRLDGGTLSYASGTDIISDGILPGAVQVPGSGDPILLLADGQTTGGYGKIAAVISSDLPLAAQARPGDSIRFQKVDVEEAHGILRQREQLLRSMEGAWNQNQHREEGCVRRFLLTVNNQRYDVTVSGIGED